MAYIPPPPPAIVYQAEESHFPHCKPYYYECDGCFINLAAASKFYVDYIPFMSFYNTYEQTINTIGQISAVVLIYVMIKCKFLFNIIPR